MKKLCKILTVALAAAMVASAAVVPASASVYTNQEVTKISNPDKGEREADGLVSEGDRENSYAWCMTARGDYVYIGTNKNIVGSVVDTIAQGLIAKGLSDDQAWALADVMMNGDIPRPTTEEGGQILRVDCKTNEIEVIYTAPLGTSFRMAITHGDNVYFGSYSVGTDDSFTTSTEEGLSNDIFCIDENDKVTKVFSSSNGTSMRAACEFEGNLFFGGVDASLELNEDWEGAAKLAILKMDETDNTKWDRVADYEDFGMLYAKNPAMTSAAASPVWDICEYNGDLYATLPNGRGFVAFKGHPAKDGETANKYGWVWEEVVGYNNTYGNPIGLNPDSSAATAGQISIVATPVVFKGELYMFDFDHTIGSVTQAVTGVLQSMSGSDVKASDYLRGMYNTLRHTQNLWKLNDETGKFEKVEGFSKLLENTTNEYVWRAQVYNDQMYLTTMDSAVLYNGITRLTNTSFVDMTAKEWMDQINNIAKFVAAMDPDVSDNMAQEKAKLEAAVTQLKVLYAQLSSNEDVQAFVQKYAETMQQIQDALINVKIELADNIFVQKLMLKLLSVENTAKEKYAEVSEAVVDYIKSHDLTALIAGDPDVALSELSEEELKDYVDQFKGKVGILVESLRIKYPELRVISRAELKEMVSQYVSEMLSQTLGEDIYEDIIKLEQDVKVKAKEQLQDLQKNLVNKVAQYYASLPEEKQQKIAAFMDKYVVPAVDEIKSDYEEQVAKLNQLKEMLYVVSHTSFAEYEAMFDAAVDMAANKAQAQIDQLNEKLGQFGLALSEQVKEQAAANIEQSKEAFKAKIAEEINKLTPDTSLNPIEAAQYGMVRTLEELDKKINKTYYDVKDAYDKIDWEGVAMYAYINDMVKEDTWGFDMVRTTDGENFELVTNDGFDDKYNYGGRSMVATKYGLYVGTANPFYGAQLFRLNDPLVNRSSVSTKSVARGGKVTVKADAKGGFGDYKYAFYYKKSTSGAWQTIGEAYGDATEASFSPSTVAKYLVKVNVKDETGKIKSKIFEVDSTKPTVSTLANESVVDKTTTQRGTPVTITGAASGGAGDYKYAFYYKKSTSKAYTLIGEEYGDAATATFTPATTAEYDVRVRVKDAAGKVVTKQLKVNSTRVEES